MKTIFQPQSVSLAKIAVFCMFCVFLISCEKEKTKDCPGFPPDVAEYFPYHSSDSLIFVNQHNDTISFHVNTIQITEKHTITTKVGRKFCECACMDPVFNFDANYINCSIYSSEKGDFPETKITFTLENSYWNNSVSSEEKYSVLGKKIEKYSDDITNSAIFGDTVRLTNNGQQISHTVIVWGEGIIEFYDQKNDFQWKSIKK